MLPINEQERLDFFRFYAEYVNGRVELLAGTGCIRYADTLALSNAVYELGYTPMVISPYYFEMDQEKLFYLMSRGLDLAARARVRRRPGPPLRERPFRGRAADRDVHEHRLGRRPIPPRHRVMHSR